jgi:hypothetical protein
VYRPKSGFSLPLEKYFGDKRFESLMEDRVLPGIAKRGLFRADVVRSWWKTLSKQHRGTAESIWIPVVFELWAQQFVDQRAYA